METALVSAIIGGAELDVELVFEAELPLLITFYFEGGKVWEIPKSLLLEGIINGKAGLFEILVSSAELYTAITLQGTNGTCTLSMKTNSLRKFVERCYKAKGDEVDISLWIVGLLSDQWKPMFREVGDGRIE